MSDDYSKQPSFIPSENFFNRLNEDCYLADYGFRMDNLTIVSRNVWAIFNKIRYWLEDYKPYYEQAKKNYAEGIKWQNKMHVFSSDTDIDTDVRAQMAAQCKARSMAAYQNCYSVLVYVMKVANIDIMKRKREKKLPVFGQIEKEVKDEQSDNFPEWSSISPERKPTIL